MENHVNDTTPERIEVNMNEAAEEEATQPATQQIIDPRRLGQHNSGLNDRDLTDIFCILHPCSMPAYRATDIIAEDAPQHIINVEGVQIRTRDDNSIDEKALADEPGTFDLAAEGVNISHNIALRLSADLKDPLAGYLFGRSPQRCDFVLGRGDSDGVKRISNTHFRIYLNEHGIIMLEDSSTNGTVVENIMLRHKEKENGHRYQHILEAGSLITLVMTPPDEDMKFIVRIPQREGVFEDEYEDNLRRYFERLKDLRVKRDARRLAAIVQNEGGKTGGAGPPDIFRQPHDTTQTVTPSGTRRHARQWRGGTKYNKIAQIGKGAFATVYMLTAKFDGTCFAAKELEKRRFMKNGIIDQKVDTEMNIMRKIKHPNIVQYIEHVDWDEYLYLIMDYVPGGDLGALVARSEKLPETMVNSVASQMLNALEYLHRLNITHRDVKPDNILIQSLDPIHVKLTDFGLSKVVDTDDTFMRTFCGTLLYCAPEVYSEYREYDPISGIRINRGRGRDKLPPQRYGHGVDVWSLGGVLFYSLCGSPPYPAKSGTTYQELLNSIMTKALDIRPLQNANVSEIGIRFLKSMLSVQPEFRPTIKALQALPWITGEKDPLDIDEDEIDMIGSDFDDDILEQGASQLSIKDGQNVGSQVDYYDDDVDVDVEEIELIRAVANESVIPDSESSESFAFMQNHPGNGRLFGEVDASALGSSGVIPQGYLNLPLSQSSESNSNNRSGIFGQTEMVGILPASKLDHSMDHEDMRDSIRSTDQTTTDETASEATTAFDPLNKFASSKQEARAASLTGAESMVGNLQMNSPSPVAMSPPTTTHYIPDFQISLNEIRQSMRRPREEEPSDDTRPNPKRMKSERQIDLPISHKIFWDQRDKSTWHDKYPKITTSQYNEAEQLAKDNGEQFTHGQPVFDKLIGIYKNAASGLLVTHPRAESEPIGNQGRRSLMKRDNGKLEENAGDNSLLPAIVHESSTLMTPDTAETSISNDDKLRATSEGLPVTGNDVSLTPSRDVFARFTSTPDSVLPLTVTVTGPLMTWGRGHDNTTIYRGDKDTRIPKYAIKLILFSLATASLGSAGQSASTFFIATKANLNILVNNVELPSYSAKNPRTPAKYWAALHHGDVVTIWSRSDRSMSIKLRFEAFVGASQTPRTEPFTIISDIEQRDELDKHFIAEEAKLMAQKTK